MNKTLVTGGAGFIGSHLVELLLENGSFVTVVDDQSTGNFTNLGHVREHPSLELIDASIGDADVVARVTADVDQVFHLAAAVGVALIAREPIQSIERNIYPTQLLLSAVHEQIKSGRDVQFFLASTSEVYGKNPKERWGEDDDLVLGPTIRPRWSYGASKAIDEFLALANHREYGLPVVVGRFFNVVGPRQTGAYGMVLPRFVDAAIANRPLTVHDDGQQERCFAHVSDVVRAVVTLMKTPAAFGKVFNIGSDQPISILDLAKRVTALAKSESAIEFQSYTAAYDEDFEDVRRRVPDLSRLQETIGHQPEFDLDGIIEAVIASKRA